MTIAKEETIKVKVRVEHRESGDTYSIHLPTLRGMDSVYINSDKVLKSESLNEKTL